MNGMINHVYSQQNLKKIKLGDFAQFGLNDEELKNLFPISYQVINRKAEFKYSEIEGNDVFLYFSYDSILRIKMDGFSSHRSCPTSIIDYEGLIYEIQPHPFRGKSIEERVLKKLYLPNVEVAGWSILDNCNSLEELYLPKLKEFYKHTYPLAYAFRCIPLFQPNKFKAVFNRELLQLSEIIPSFQKLLDHLPNTENQITWIN